MQIVLPITNIYTLYWKEMFARDDTIFLIDFMDIQKVYYEQKWTEIEQLTLRHWIIYDYLNINNRFNEKCTLDIRTGVIQYFVK